MVESRESRQPRKDKFEIPRIASQLSAEVTKRGTATTNMHVHMHNIGRGHGHVATGNIRSVSRVRVVSEGGTRTRRPAMLTRARAARESQRLFGIALSATVLGSSPLGSLRAVLSLGKAVRIPRVEPPRIDGAPCPEATERVAMETDSACDAEDIEQGEREREESSE